MLPMRTGSTNFDYTSFDKGIEIVSSRAKAADYIYIHYLMCFMIQLKQVN